MLFRIHIKFNYLLISKPLLRPNPAWIFRISNTAVTHSRHIDVVLHSFRMQIRSASLRVVPRVWRVVSWTFDSLWTPRRPDISARSVSGPLWQGMHCRALKAYRLVNGQYVHDRWPGSELTARRSKTLTVERKATAPVHRQYYVLSLVNCNTVVWRLSLTARKAPHILNPFKCVCSGRYDFFGERLDVLPTTAVALLPRIYLTVSAYFVDR